MTLLNKTYGRLAGKQSRGKWLKHTAEGMLALALAVTLMIIDTTQSYAQQSATCRSLQAQLASIETGRGSKKSSQYLKYDRAMSQQLSQIKKTERAATRNGCQLLRTNNCKRINSSLQSMYANMDSLRRTRDSLAGGGASQEDRNRVLSALNRNGCVETASIQNQDNDQPRRRTLLEQIFGTKTYTDRGTTDVTNPDLDSRSGIFRTLCVRTCDGYYFPISFSTTKNRFESDAEQCQQLCPGAETQLFYHSMPNGDAEESISFRTGEPYASLTNAFSYRKNVNAECSCRGGPARGGFQEIAGTTQSEREVAEAKAVPVIPTPQFRADQGLDIETEQNLDGGLTLQRLAAINNASEPSAALNKTIRIVGPEFFPVQ
jgi:hypothetical protein